MTLIALDSRGLRAGGWGGQCSGGRKLPACSVVQKVLELVISLPQLLKELGL